MSKIHVLVVEDESLVAMSLKQQLTTLGYGVTTIAKSFEEALRACSISEPDLVLMDIKLKGEKDGIDTANRINDLYELPIIFLSDVKDKETLRRAVRSPSDYFIEKPVSDFNLKTQIEFALEKHIAKQTHQKNFGDPLQEVLLVKADSGYTKIQSSDILWVKANGAYCRVKTHNEELLLSKNMREFCDHLAPQTFIRIHKSHTINATKIDRFEGNTLTIGGDELQIGKSYMKSFKQRMNIV